MAAKKIRRTLFTIPRELRDKIYEYVFSGVVRIKPGKTDITSRNASLLAVSRQLRAEAAKPYYQNTAFEFNEEFNGRGLAPCRKFLSMISPQHRAFITVMRINFWGYEREDWYAELDDHCFERFLERQRREKDLLLKMLKAKLGNMAPQEDALRTRVTVWVEDRYVEGWTAKPLEVPLVYMKENK